ncbi:MAG: glutamate 5-kinase [Clostridiales bacterium]|nr:glutamate 5-kinase [Clostridiales bacterium]
MCELERKLRIVVKVGTSSLTRVDGSRNLRNMDLLARVLSDLKGMGHEIILVSSGAIGMGAGKLGMTARPSQLRMKQAAAAVGQCEMMHLYDKFFGECGQTVAQVLLTDDDVKDPFRQAHLSGTFAALLGLGVIPVVNENDSVSAAEIETGDRKVLGDNDTLSAIVAGLCRADLLVILSDIDGLYDSDPRQDPEARLISRVTEIDESIYDMAGGVGSRWGTGGMVTKLEAARVANRLGIDLVLTNSNRMDALYDIAEGKDVGTRFVATR